MDTRLSAPVARRLSRRQFLALAGSVAAGTALAACAPAAAPTGSEGAAAGGEEAATQLVAWFTDRRTINEMTEAVAIPAFQELHPNIEVEMQFVPENELQQKLLTANAAGNAPDVSSIDETFLDTLQKNGVLRPIPDEVIDVKQEMGDLTADLYRIPHASPDARFYALPNGVFSSQLYYNAALLDELGYTPEDIPTSWDDFLIWARDITQWDGDTLVRSGMAFYGNEFSIYEDLRYHYAGSLEGNFFPTSDTVEHADEWGITAWEFIMDLYTEWRLDSIEEGLNSRERFGFGNAVTLYNWTWFNGVMDTQYTDIPWGLVLPPTDTGEPSYGRRGPDVGFTVTTQDDAKQEEAWTFYRYLVSPAYLADYCKLRGVQPSLKEMWDDPAFSEDAGPQWAPISIKNRPQNSVDPGFWPRELVDINNRMVPSIRDEGEDVTTVLQRADQEGTEFLQANPQWSILSTEDYEAHPQWLTPQG